MDIALALNLSSSRPGRFSFSEASAFSSIPQAHADDEESGSIHDKEDSPFPFSP